MTDSRHSPVFVFIDESGNFDFSERGTKHFVMSAFVTQNPTLCTRGLADLTYEMLARGLSDQVPFHASDNSLGTRRLVLARICRQEDGCFVLSAVTDKSEAHPSAKTPESLYLGMGSFLIDNICDRINNPDTPLIVLFDSALPARHRSLFQQAIRKSLKVQRRHFVVAIRPVKQDLNGQIADFYAWAAFRAWERNDFHWLQELPANHRVENFQLK